VFVTFNVSIDKLVESPVVEAVYAVVCIDPSENTRPPSVNLLTNLVDPCIEALDILFELYVNIYTIDIKNYL
jgi:hypothetical protein